MAVTPNLNLHQWGPDDAFLREDFNEDLGKIDGGIAAAPTAGFVVGTYVGSGEWNVPTTVELGFAPSAVIVRAVGGGTLPSILLAKGQEISCKNSFIFKLTETGFCVNLVGDGYGGYEEPCLNRVGTYCYIAFR